MGRRLTIAAVLDSNPFRSLLLVSLAMVKREMVMTFCTGVFVAWQ